MSTPVEGLPPNARLVEQPENFEFTAENLERALSAQAIWSSEADRLPWT